MESSKTTNKTYIKGLKEKVGQKVEISGWVSVVRNQGGIKFLILRDTTGEIQTVVTKQTPLAFKEAIPITNESVVKINGVVKDEKQAPGGIEILIREITVLSSSTPNLPIPITGKGGSETDLQKRLDWRWLDLRKPEKQLIFEVWTTMEQAFRRYWTENDYTEIHSPKLMGAPSEGGAELFEVKYFDRKAYLAQSPQFYKQMAMASGFDKVFEVGPVFRANPSFTSRHDTEFTMYDIELSFVESHQDVMAEEEKAIADMLRSIDEKHGQEILKAYGRKITVPQTPFPQMTMKQAKEILSELGVKSDTKGNLNPKEERKLSEYVRNEKNHEFVFVTEYPIEERPFYHMRLEENPKLTKSFDLLWNGIEITTGAQREHRLEILEKQAQEKRISLESIKFYLDFFRYGCPPHGGCALGPTRMLMKIFDIQNVREVTFLYRGVNRLTP